MDSLFEILRTSTDNDQRKLAASQLRQIQETNPHEFLLYSWEIISSSIQTIPIRFFIASALVDFIEQSWHNTVAKEIQLDMIYRYLQLLIKTEILPSLSLTRKIAVLLSLMVTRSGIKAMPGSLPEPIQRTVTLLAESAVQGILENNNNNNKDLITQRLLCLHIFLKESQRKRIGGIFVKVCTLLVPVMSTLFSASISWDYIEYYLPMLYLLKCALRVFGFGVFEPNFYPFLLETTWRIAKSIGIPNQNQQQLQYRQRLLEYAIKIQLKMISVFPSRLHELSIDFFISIKQQGGIEENNNNNVNSNDETSLFSLITAIMLSPNGLVSTEKLLCRCMRIFSMMLSTEDSDEFTCSCLKIFSNSSFMYPLLERIILLLEDDTSEYILSEWNNEPERYASEFDKEIDDETSLTCCAEELLLAFTGSTIFSNKSLEISWKVVNTLLTSGNISQITAALHAIGTCYYTMSVGQEDATSYLTFLNTKLLPLITHNNNNNNNNNNNEISPFILRRVVWVVGMWCEFVKDPLMRYQVHSSFISLLLFPSTSIVVLLTTLRSIGNFIDDANFTFNEFSPEFVHNVLLTIQKLLPIFKTPSGVKGLFSLVHAMIENGLLHIGNGDILIDILLPAVFQILNSIESGNNNNNNNKDKEEVDAGALGILLETLGSCAKITNSNLRDRLWTLFHSVILPCTTPNTQLVAWVEDEAWELLLIMCQTSHIFNSQCNEALLWCLKNILTRDIPILHIIIRCLYTLLLLCSDIRILGEVMDINLIDHLIKLLAETPRNELTISCFTVLAVIIKKGDLNIKSYIRNIAIQQLLNSDSVQGETCIIYFTILISLSLPPFTIYTINDNENLELLACNILQHPNGNSLAERIVLLLDISPSSLVSEILIGFLIFLKDRLPQLLSEEDVKMLMLTLNGNEKQQQEDNNNNNNNNNNNVIRDKVEMLLELFDDGNLTTSSPHVHRLTSLFGINLNF